jgi:dynein heavy chain
MSNYPKPPDAVAMVMEPIMILLGEKKDWDTAKKHMKQTESFLQQLKQFDVSKVTENTLRKIRTTYISQANFNPDFVGKKSVPAGQLCKWVLALDSYQKVFKNIVPKKEKLAIVSKQAGEAKATLDEKLALVKEVKDKVAALQAHADQLNSEKAALEAQINRDRNRMSRAEKLVVLLKDEGIRWDLTVKDLEIQINKLVGDVFLSCACISYFGGFSGTYRTSLTDLWTTECISRGIPTGEDFNLIKVMGDPVQISTWNMNYLPSDRTSLENGILTTKAERYALCIDP